MNTKLALAALFIAASATGACAKSINICFPGYPNGIDITTTKGSIYVAGTGTGSISGIFAGVEARAGASKYFILSTNQGGPDQATFYMIQLPLADGNAAYVYNSTNGSSLTNTFSGTYNLGTPDSC